MKTKLFYLFICFTLLSLHPMQAQIDVLHLKSDITDTIFGQAVADPYRWMENVNSDSVKQWLKEQKKITSTAQLSFSGRLTTAYHNINDNSGYRVADAVKKGPWYFKTLYTLSTTRPSPILYYRKSLDDANEVAFDPNDYSGKQVYTIAGCELSDDNRYLAVALSPGGSDWREIHVRDLVKQKDLTDYLSHVRFSGITWWKDGFFYASYKKNDNETERNAALKGQELYYHKLGDEQKNDRWLMSLSDSANSIIYFEKTSNKRFLVVSKPQRIKGEWHEIIAVLDLNKGLNSEWKMIASTNRNTKAGFSVIDAIDSSFILETNFNASNHRVLLASLDSLNHFTELIPEKQKVLLGVRHIHHELVAIYFSKGAYEVNIYNYKGKMTAGIKFDSAVSVHGFYGEPQDSEMIFYQNTFYMPPIAYRYNFNTHKTTLVEKTRVHYDAHNYTSKVVSYKSKDGTEVCMYLTYKKGLKRTGNNPVLLYGYGGFGVSMTPFFSFQNILLFENGGVLAVPLILGGGEMGSDWHHNGQRLKKQNSFDDFIAAAEYLIKEGYTNKEHLAIMGGSNGGLLVGAVITQRPELFKAAIAQVGAFDMVRFHKFTGGRYWEDEYGSPDDSIQFNNLFSYSPLHHVKPNTEYPATLFITGRQDDRVPPFHTYKFLARLQEQSTGTNPHLLFFEEDAGHHGATGYDERNWEEAFELAFIYKQMGLSLNTF